MLRLKHLSKEFYNLKALHSFSLAIEPGEIIAVLGPNGAGKSTLFKIAAGLLQPTQGKLETDLERWPRIGYKPERLFFPEQMTLRKYLSTCVGLTDLPKSQHKQAVLDVIEKVGLQAVANNRVRNCSKGMRQRLGLAQALLGDPQLLILDEPGDGLDPLGQQDMQALLRQLRDEGKSILLSSHQLGEVTAVCTRLVILRRGMMIYQKPIEEALSERPQVILDVDRHLGVIEPLLTSLHPKIKIQDDYRSVAVQEEALPLRRDVMRLLLAADYDILKVVHQRSTLADIYAEVVRS